MTGVPNTKLSTNSLRVRDDLDTGEICCDRCIELQRLLGERDLTIAGLQHQLRRAAGAEQALRNDLSQRQETDPKSQEVRAVLAGWEARHPRAKTPMTGKRAGTVRKALRLGFTVEQLKLALDGLAKFPYVGNSGRKPTGTPGERYDDVEHALRDESTIERFIGYATDKPPHAPAAAPAKPAAAAPRAQPAGDPVDRLLHRLEGVKPAGLNKWNARCPAHEDRHASLSVSVGRDGVVAHCFAGCTADAIAHATGMPLSEWFDIDEDLPKRVALAVAPEPLPTQGMLDEWQTRLLSHTKLLARLVIVRGWRVPALTKLGVGWDGERLVLPVYDEHGALLNVSRYLPGAKVKMLALKHRERGLFPTPESVGGATVWIVEGEPDAVAAHSVGLPAVGLPGVAKWDEAWGPRFANRRVIVCCDCDQQGRDAAARIVQTLTAEGVDARSVDLDPARSDKFDLTDFIVAGGKRGDLEHVASIGLRSAA